MFDHKKVVRAIAQVGLVLALTAGAALFLVGPASGQSYGNDVHNCYGIYWNTDWNQECTSAGAKYAGDYESVADCKAPQVNDIKMTKTRPKGNKTSYDGKDCGYGIHYVRTQYS